MAEVLNGRDYIMYVDTETAITAARGADYQPILCEVSSDFNASRDEQTVSNKCNVGGWGSTNPGNGSWSFSGEFQAIDPATGDASAITMNDILALQIAGTKFWVKRSLKDSATGVEIVREGVVWISDYTDTSNTDDPFTFSATFTGVGEPIITTPVGG